MARSQRARAGNSPGRADGAASRRYAGGTKDAGNRTTPRGARPAAGPGQDADRPRAGQSTSAAVPAQKDGAAPKGGAGQRGSAGQRVSGGQRGGAGQKGSAAKTGTAARKGSALPGSPRWLQVSTLVLSVAGLGVSVYLTIAHFTTSSILACSGNGVVNCTKVTTSSESEVFGVLPVAVLGLAFYVFMVAVNSPWAWRWKRPEIYPLRLASVIIGMIFVLYLLYAEIIEIGNICLWCTSVHVITFLMFVLLVFHATGRPDLVFPRRSAAQRKS
jgi:uncharacterized membrane protein